MELFSEILGKSLARDAALALRRHAFDSFRKPFLKQDMHTHGPLWNQYAVPDGVVDSKNLAIRADTQGYVLVDGKGEEFFVAVSTLGEFITYLETRADGIFPVVYFFDRNFTFCLGENGERGAMQPVYLYKGARKLAGASSGKLMEDRS